MIFVDVEFTFKIRIKVHIEESMATEVLFDNWLSPLRVYHSCILCGQNPKSSKLILLECEPLDIILGGGGSRG